MSSLGSLLRLVRAHVALLLAELTSIAAEARRIVALLALSLLLIVGGSLVLTAGFAVAAGESAFGSGIWGAMVAGPLLATSGVLIAGVALRAPRSLLLMVPVAGVGAGLIASLPLGVIESRATMGASWTAGSIAALGCAIAVVRAADRSAIRSRLLPTESVAAARTTATTARAAAPNLAAAVAEVTAARAEIDGPRAPKARRGLGETLFAGVVSGMIERLRDRSPRS